MIVVLAHKLRLYSQHRLHFESLPRHTSLKSGISPRQQMKMGFVLRHDSEQGRGWGCKVANVRILTWSKKRQNYLGMNGASRSLDWLEARFWKDGNKIQCIVSGGKTQFNVQQTNSDRYMIYIYIYSRCSMLQAYCLLEYGHETLDLLRDWPVLDLLYS